MMASSFHIYVTKVVKWWWQMCENVSRLIHVSARCLTCIYQCLVVCSNKTYVSLHWKMMAQFNSDFFFVCGEKLLNEDPHNLDYCPSIIGIKLNGVKSVSWSFKLLCFVYPCQLVIEFEGCDMFPWRLCAPPPHQPPSPHCQLRWIVIRAQASDWPTD
jgi:hypothetical protein